jgi:restriction endonuclease Mrr
VKDEIPSVQDLRWPLLVLIDAGRDDDVFGLEDRVAERLGLSQEAREAVDPGSDRRYYTKRLEQALEDLYQADAIEPNDDGTSLRITDVGRRLNETQARALPEVIASARPVEQASSTTDDEPSGGGPSVVDWIATILDSIP